MGKKFASYKIIHTGQRHGVIMWSSIMLVNRLACLLAKCFATLDMLPPLVCVGLQHLLQAGFVVSVGLGPVGNVSEIIPYFALCICCVYKPWTVGRSMGSLVFAAMFHVQAASCIWEEKNNWHTHSVYKEWSRMLHMTEIQMSPLWLYTKLA